MRPRPDRAQRTCNHSAAPHLRPSRGRTDRNFSGAWRVKIFVFGSSITSSYWNGAATYYRGIYKHLHAFGHEIIFAEPDIYDRQRHRDAGPFPYVDVIVYSSPHDIEYLLHQASQADLVIKHSGVGAE